jgi:hypothetical protein
MQIKRAEGFNRSGYGMKLPEGLIRRRNRPRTPTALPE